MADVLSKAARSELMSRIRSRGNERTELTLARLFRREGITGWRRHVSLMLETKRPPNHQATFRRRTTVRPDFVFRKERVVIFVDGCFWHGCPIHGTRPKDNRAFWRKKILANQARDRRVHSTLRKSGWKVLRIWEHNLCPKGLSGVLRRIQRAFPPKPNRW